MAALAEGVSSGILTDSATANNNVTNSNPTNNNNSHANNNNNILKQNSQVETNDSSAPSVSAILPPLATTAGGSSQTPSAVGGGGGSGNNAPGSSSSTQASPNAANSGSTDNDNGAFRRVILTDWLTYTGAGQTPKTEILEFSWAVYDVESECVLEKARHILRPTDNNRSDIPPSFLKLLKLSDSRPLEYAKTLQQVLQEFDTACSTVVPPSACVVIGSAKLRDELLTETFRKSLSVPKSLRGVLDLATLASHFYPQQFANAHESELLQPRHVAAKLQAPISSITEEFPSVDGCIVMSQIVKKMHLDEIVFQSQHLSTVITAPSSEALKAATNTLAQKTDTSRPTTTTPNSQQFVIRMRGIPWGATEDDIIKFMEPVCTVTPADVHIATYYDGKASGEAYVRLPSMSDRDKCLQELHGRHMGRRWIEVFKASEHYLQHFALFKDPEMLERRGAVRLRGLPWSTNEYEIVKFFTDAGFNVTINSVVLGQSHNQRFNGDAWVLLETPEIAEEARRTLHKKTMGRRYIEVFQSTVREVDMARRGYMPTTMSSSLSRQPHYYEQRCAPYGPPNMGLPHGGAAALGRSAYNAPMGPSIFSYHHGIRGPPPAEAPSGNLGTTVVRLRGLPYHANENHIVEFFHGFGMIAILPATAPIDGRPSGEAYVEFVSPEEAWRALKSRNGALMDKRYIELFPSTKQEMELAASGMDPREIRSHYIRS